MTPDQLLAKVADHEDNFVERKPEGASAGELRQTACAFANSVPEGREAVLFVGIHDKTGDVLGVANTDALQKRIRDAFHGDCYPPIEYTAEVLEVNGNKIVAVVIPASSGRPHFSGPAYVRVGSESPKANPQQYDELILSRVEKVRQILKYRNALFTVAGVGYKLGSHKPLPDAAYTESCECRVTACDAHVVSFESVSSNRKFSEPLAHITFTWDDEKWRPKLLVTFPR